MESNTCKVYNMITSALSIEPHSETNSSPFPLSIYCSSRERTEKPTKTYVLGRQNLSILFHKSRHDVCECGGVVSGVVGEDGGGSKREGHLPPHQAQGCVVGEGRICQVGLVEEVVVD